MNKTLRPADDARRVLETGSFPIMHGSGMFHYQPVPSQKKVLLIGSGSLFDNGVYDLLHCSPGLRITYARYKDDISILKEVASCKPDVVVLVLSGRMNPDFIVGMLMSFQMPMGLRLVLLSIETVAIEIYERENTGDDIKSATIRAVKVDDFIRAVSKSWSEVSSSHLL